MANFTKCNWTFDENTGEIKADGKAIAQVYGATKFNHSCNAKKVFANARLIASAPELYEMLREEIIGDNDIGLVGFMREDKARKLLAYIDGSKETGNERS